jgi:hypothetical protein
MTADATRIVFTVINREAPYAGRVVLDHVIGGHVWMRSVFSGTAFDLPLSEFERYYAPEPDKSWDDVMRRQPHPGLDGDGI